MINSSEYVMSDYPSECDEWYVSSECDEWYVSSECDE